MVAFCSFEWMESDLVTFAQIPILGIALCFIEQLPFLDPFDLQHPTQASIHEHVLSPKFKMQPFWSLYTSVPIADISPHCIA